MIQIIINRVCEAEDETYGVMIIGGRPRFVTLERGWRDNERGVSCIPVGEYECVEHDSPKFGSTYLVKGVPSRSHILFHAGNTSVDTEGCILIGSSFNPNLGGSGITSSRDAFLKFLRLLKDQKSFQLSIKNLA